MNRVLTGTVRFWSSRENISRNILILAPPSGCESAWSGSGPGVWSLLLSLQKKVICHYSIVPLPYLPLNQHKQHDLSVCESLNYLNVFNDPVCKQHRHISVVSVVNLHNNKLTTTHTHTHNTQQSPISNRSSLWVTWSSGVSRSDHNIIVSLLALADRFYLFIKHEPDENKLNQTSGSLALASLCPSSFCVNITVYTRVGNLMLQLGLLP